MSRREELKERSRRLKLSALVITLHNKFAILYHYNKVIDNDFKLRYDQIEPPGKHLAVLSVGVTIVIEFVLQIKCANHLLVCEYVLLLTCDFFC